ncbi:hypothetical protein BDV25DRAFT_138006 [Aspergillus avenaceus]|uniref:Uncharacterized protein n=1 Tax=Aspergillus avenaceus TaxID=36643 RepID=A0A5N6U105_ASPAV|nr:hypothetical protein BDV25DRAFT_138006 [Aspergillus avenaceus]
MERGNNIREHIRSFVEQCRLGNYRNADILFDQTLKDYIDHAPVAIAYADMYLGQGCYGLASKYLDSRISKMKDLSGTDSGLLLVLMKALADIHHKGALRSALVKARQAMRTIKDRTGSQKTTPLNEIQASRLIRIYEFYIRIVVIAFQTSEWVNSEWMHCPWAPLLPYRPGLGFIDWYHALLKKGNLFEASQVLHAIMPILPTLPWKEVITLLKFKAPQSGHASCMINMYQARIGLDLAHRAVQMGVAQWAIEATFNFVRMKLEAAEKLWNEVEPKENLTSFAPLFLLRVEFDLRWCMLQKGPEFETHQSRLKEVKSEADKCSDFTSYTEGRILFALCSTAHNRCHALSKTFEYLSSICGNTLGYIRLCDLLAPWTVSCDPLPATPSTYKVLLSYHGRVKTAVDTEWKQILTNRYPVASIPGLAKCLQEEVTFDVNQTDYPLAFDIPLYNRDFHLKQIKPSRSSTTCANQGQSAPLLRNFPSNSWDHITDVELRMLCCGMQGPEHERTDLSRCLQMFDSTDKINSSQVVAGASSTPSNSRGANRGIAQCSPVDANRVKQPRATRTRL